MPIFKKFFLVLSDLYIPHISFCESKDLVFAQISGHVGILKNINVDFAAKHVFENPISKRLVILYYDLSVLTNICTKS